ncbi:Fur family ferric uptake regulator [Tepidamorphus gemmatus]|jgi:Fur family zinc uptake transcriptional regulator|uniref:Fur family ferric uptake regulator n=1 Tax=Tepidamorphus gemmatus TaxID=747076 RepID=A0A4R3MDN5_9HYPH|nr:transcriptional repressor [Tepidamorphus gemmatus]TCT11874.1 Fur family ferric uptake regulator [Tepidamorphus gemmatus]
MADFPAPNHDHSHCADRIVRTARAVCRRRGARLTSQREKVLELLAQGHRPMGAYELMDAMAGDGRRPAPITVYRALDFLVQQGLVHRIESRNAFIACTAGDARHSATVFLICRACGNVGEALAEGVGEALDSVAAANGFAPDLTVIEIDGLCRHCAQTAAGAQMSGERGSGERAATGTAERT